MKSWITIVFLFISSVYISAQNNIGIGTTSPSASALLDITSTTKGFLTPRMTYAQKIAIPTPATGLLVYQTNTSGANQIGLYYYDGAIWKRFARSDEIGSGGNNTWTPVGDDQCSNVLGDVGIGVTTGITEKLFLKGDMLITNTGGPLGQEGQTAELKLHGASTGSGQISFMEPDTTSIGGMIYYAPILNSFTLRNGFNDLGYLSLFQNGNMSFGPSQTTDAISKFHITDGDFANLDTHHGYLMLGEQGESNIVLGNYEILARNNGAISPLYLQQEGGAVRIGNGSVATGTKLQITNGDPASMTEHGHFVIGSVTSQNLVMDTDEIQSRDNGVASYLKVQQGVGVGLQVGYYPSAILPDTKIYVPGGNDVSLTLDGLLHLGIKSGLNMAFDQNEIQARSNGAASLLVLQNNGGDFRIGSNKLFVANSGNVGIGTSSPIAKLDVAGRIRVVQSGEAIGMDGASPNIGMWYNGTFKSKIEQLSNQLYIFSNDKVHLDGDQVAIGNMLTTADAYKLSVTGKIICEELKVELSGNWPDYVFADEYRLQPLSELKSFIDSNNHLPNIPKASEIEKEGFEVGEMNRKLLEKVEELTLYVIQLQEQIDELKSVNRDR